MQTLQTSVNAVQTESRERKPKPPPRRLNGEYNNSYQNRVSEMPDPILTIGDRDSSLSLDHDLRRNGVRSKDGHHDKCPEVNLTIPIMKNTIPVNVRGRRSMALVASGASVTIMNYEPRIHF